MVSHRSAKLLIPLHFLTRHARRLSKSVVQLKETVSSIEEQVNKAQNTHADRTDFKDLIGRLHLCDAEAIKLHRRWVFQCTFAATICEFIKLHDPTMIRLPTSNRAFKDYRLLSSAAALQLNLSQNIQYDLEVLPRRISNQSTAVRSPGFPDIHASIHADMYRYLT